MIDPTDVLLGLIGGAAVAAIVLAILWLVVS